MPRKYVASQSNLNTLAYVLTQIGEVIERCAVDAYNEAVGSGGAFSFSLDGNTYVVNSIPAIDSAAAVDMMTVTVLDGEMTRRWVLKRARAYWAGETAWHVVATPYTEEVDDDQETA